MTVTGSRDETFSLFSKAIEDRRREVRKRRLGRITIDKETYDRLKINEDTYIWDI